MMIRNSQDMRAIGTAGATVAHKKQANLQEEELGQACGLLCHQVAEQPPVDLLHLDAKPTWGTIPFLDKHFLC